MKWNILTLVILVVFVTSVNAQSDSGNTVTLDTSARTCVFTGPEMSKTKQAIEVESLFPMFFSGGYHFCIAYRYHNFRVRISVINGGDYDAEPAGTKNSTSEFKRYYKTSPGIFLGYNVWRHLEVYSYLELHTFKIEQKSTGLTRDIHSNDIGGGMSYQFFIGPHIYLQPGVHVYLRSDHSADFNGTVYNIPNVDIAPVIRLGYRIWGKYLERK
ncbi:MAG: hypothetical protein LWX70_10270 [Sphingobacteriia bacterium]|nr:hypothetical protein [Sphingobacteriia bacterium]